MYTGLIFQKQNYIPCTLFSPCCVKCQFAEGSFIHMYWSCTSLNKYWRYILHTLSRVLNIKLEPNPLIALFGVMEEEEELTTSKRCTLSFASLLVWQAILLKWKDASPPTQAQWLEDIMSCLRLEKIRYSLQQSNGKFQKVWGHFSKYIPDPIKALPLGAALLHCTLFTHS